MLEILKDKERLKKIQSTLKSLNEEWDVIEEEVDSMRYRMDCIEDHIEYLENEEVRILESINIKMKNNIKKKNNQNGFESKIWLSSLFTNKDGYKKELSYVYVDENAIYAIDGYRAIEYRHQNLNINRTMFINVDELLDKNIDLTLFNDVDEDSCGIEIIKNIIDKYFNKTTGYIFHIDSNDFIKEFLYKEIDDGKRSIYILNLKQFKIAIKKEFIEDMLFIFKDSNFSVSYSGATKPMFFYNDEIKIIILPIRMNNIDRV